MKWRFEADPTAPELEVVVRKDDYDQEVQEMAAYLAAFGTVDTEMFPVKTADRLQLVQVADVRLIEVLDGELVLYIQSGTLRTLERLNHFQERVKHKNLVQISRYAVMNIQHLQYLEASFSGNMTAFLGDKLKITVSRRYLKTLEKTLGL